MSTLQSATFLLLQVWGVWFKSYCDIRFKSRSRVKWLSLLVHRHQRWAPQKSIVFLSMLSCSANLHQMSEVWADLRELQFVADWKAFLVSQRPTINFFAVFVWSFPNVFDRMWWSWWPPSGTRYPVCWVHCEGRFLSDHVDMSGSVTGLSNLFSCMHVFVLIVIPCSTPFWHNVYCLFCFFYFCEAFVLGWSLILIPICLISFLLKL